MTLNENVVDKVFQLWQARVETASRRLRRSPARAFFTVRDLPAADRPRERMSALGAESLSQQELLACLLGRGIAGESVLVTAQRLLNQFGSLHGIADASIEQLSQVRGVGFAKAAQLKAACEIGRRLRISSEAMGKPVRTADQAILVAQRALSGKKKEYFILLILDARHRVSKTVEVSVGSLDTSIVHPRETFREAIVASAAAIILAHNHPSGDPAPSPEDLELTHRLIEAGRLIGIPVLDHIIVGAVKSVSLKAGGFWPREDEEDQSGA